MGYRGAAFTRRKHRTRAALLTFFAAALGTFIAWVIAVEIHFYTFTPLDAAPKLGWWFAALPVQIVKSMILQNDSGSDPADASALEVASMCIVNGVLAAMICWVVALWLTRSDAGFIRNLVRSFWHIEARLYWRRVLILSGWGGALGSILTLSAIGLAYLARGTDSGAFLVWAAVCMPLRLVCAVIGKDWPDFNHGPTVANILAALLVNSVLLAAVSASLLITTRFLLADPRVTSS